MQRGWLEARFTFGICLKISSHDSDSDSGWVQIGITIRANFEISNLDIAIKYYFWMVFVTPDLRTYKTLERCI